MLFVLGSSSSKIYTRLSLSGIGSAHHIAMATPCEEMDLATPREEMGFCCWQTAIRGISVEIFKKAEEQQSPDVQTDLVLDLVHSELYDLGQFPEGECLTIKELQDDYYIVACHHGRDQSTSREQISRMIKNWQLKVTPIKEAICGLRRRWKIGAPCEKRVYNTILPHAAKRQTFATEKQTGQEDEEQHEGQEHVTDSLYVMTNSLLPNDVKIGRSADVNQRRKSLEASQHFYIYVEAEFPGYGYLERDVHDLLKK